MEFAEYKPVLLSPGTETDSLAHNIWENYRKYFSIEFPSIQTQNKWVITNQGWVGQIRLESGEALYLSPKTPINNIFGMLELAYKIQPFLNTKLTECDSFPALSERLAHVLAKRVLDRGRKGFHRCYVEYGDYLPCVRGRICLVTQIARPVTAKMYCQYDEFTGDIVDNQIIAWALYLILRSGVCKQRTVVSDVRRAYREILNVSSPVSFNSKDCLCRIYNRLQSDYEPIHALCRFFIGSTGPGLRSGTRKMVPFLIDMDRLFEMYVAEWLKMHQPLGIRVRAHDRMGLGLDNDLVFDIDIVIEDSLSGRVNCVVDTKYKVPNTPSNEDVSQVVAYAVAQSCKHAVLVYPSPLLRPLDLMIGDIHLRTLSFSLSGDLDSAGHNFARQLFRSDLLRPS